MKICFGFCFFGIGRKPTHDFLSLYTHSTAQQDPRPSSQGNFFFFNFFLNIVKNNEIYFFSIPVV